MRVKPRPGIILAGVPATGADIEDDLAEQWIADRLVYPVEPPRPKRGRPPKVR